MSQEIHIKNIVCPRRIAALEEVLDELNFFYGN
jgi:hypothetical protein